MSDVLNTAVVGVGNWGKNLLRNFANAKRCQVRFICDLDEDTLNRQASMAPNAVATTDFDRILDNSVDAVVIATKAVTHFDLAKKALEAGKHVYVEKPLCLSSKDAEELLALAQKKDRKLMVGHLLLYHPCVDYLRALLASKDLGDVHYMYTQRINLGVVRQDENAWWSLAPHDVSVVCDLFNAQPTSVSASGQCYLQSGVEDVVFATLHFADGRMAHVHVSWLDPHKIRKMTIVGTKRMATFDDMDAAEKIRLYDKGADVKEGYESYERAISIRTGDIVIPKVPNSEPLRVEAQHFIDCVLDNKPIKTDGADGLRVVRTLEAGDKSIKQGGAPVTI